MDTPPPPQTPPPPPPYDPPAAAPPVPVPRNRQRAVAVAAASLLALAGSAAAGAVLSGGGGESADRAGRADRPEGTASAGVAASGWKDCMGVSQKSENPYLHRDQAFGIQVTGITCQEGKVQVKLTAMNWTGKAQDIVSKIGIANAAGCMQQTTVTFSDAPEEKDPGPVQPNGPSPADGFATASYANTCDQASGFVVKAYEAYHADPGRPPTPTASPTPSPKPTPTPTPSPTPSFVFKESDYTELEERDYKKMVRDPDAHVGKSYKIYGRITQFDAATGRNIFRANIGPGRLAASKSYDYDDNAYFLGVSTVIEDVVEDDLVVLYVQCLGSYSYRTALGGTLTVPSFNVVKVNRYGTAS
ncbi:hypothetical protein ACFTWH_07800 [Streptomyces sp. NPDC057011]|uniref:hypothetical protein n=1 Tax=unclassified Streptomyces TaxID=2593676 RepID=UPI00363763F9